MDKSKPCYTFLGVGHVHLSIHSWHDLCEILASVGMNILVFAGFVIDYRQNTTTNG